MVGFLDKETDDNWISRRGKLGGSDIPSKELLGS